MQTGNILMGVMVGLKMKLRGIRAALSSVALRSNRLSLAVMLSATVLVILSWVAVAAVLQQRHRDAIDAEFRQNANLAKALSEQTVRVVAAADQALLRTGLALAAGEFDTHSLERYASETGLAPTILTQLSLIGTDGHFVGSNLDPDGTKTGHVDLSQREHVAIHLWPDKAGQARTLIMANGLFVGRPVLGKVSGKRTIQLSRKLERNGQVLGVIVASLDASYFERIYGGVDLGREGGVTLAGLDGVVRARVIGGKSQPMEARLPVTRMTQSPGRYITASSLDGVERIIANLHAAPYPLHVFVATSKAEALADWSAYRNALLGLLVLLDIALICAAAIFVASIGRLERKNQALQHSEREARVANEAKTEFLAAISHELRTPLTSILGFSELMENRLQEIKYREAAGLITKSANYLNALLTEILDFSKVEAGAMELRCAAHDLREMVFSTTDLFSVSAASKGLELHCRVADTAPAELVCDGLRVKQILNNLLSNAIKFTEQGTVDVYVEPLDGQLALRVRDTGPGIAKADQEKIFERFRQGDAKVSYQHGGTGLGLALARGLAQLMGGSLTLSSASGAGACFTLTLPLNA